MRMSYSPSRQVPASSLRNDLRFEFPDAAPEMLDAFVAQSAVQLCSKWPVLRRRIVVPTEHGMANCALDDADDGTRLQDVLFVDRIDGSWGCAGGPVNDRAIVGTPTWRRRKEWGSDYPVLRVTPPFKQDGFTRCWWDSTLRELHIGSPHPDASYAVTVSITPRRGVLGFPEDLYERWYDCILLLAKARTVMVAGQQYTNPAVAPAYLKEVEETVELMERDFRDELLFREQRQKDMMDSFFGQRQPVAPGTENPDAGAVRPVQAGPGQ